MQTASSTIETPLGRYVLVAGPRGLTHFQPEGSSRLPLPQNDGDGAMRRALDAARRRLELYFAGDCDALASLALAPIGTPFQHRVWRALRGIPAGSTASYGEIARRVGSPRAARAIGAANHENPIAIAIPCHRVTGSDGRLVGYAGGVERQRWLLAHERACAGHVYAASSKSKMPSTRAERALARNRESAAASI